MSGLFKIDKMCVNHQTLRQVERSVEKISFFPDEVDISSKIRKSVIELRNILDT